MESTTKPEKEEKEKLDTLAQKIELYKRVKDQLDKTDADDLLNLEGREGITLAITLLEKIRDEQREVDYKKPVSQEENLERVFGKKGNWRKAGKGKAVDKKRDDK